MSISLQETGSVFNLICINSTVSASQMKITLFLTMLTWFSKLFGQKPNISAKQHERNDFPRRLWLMKHKLTNITPADPAEASSKKNMK